MKHRYILFSFLAIFLSLIGISSVSASIKTTFGEFPDLPSGNVNISNSTYYMIMKNKNNSDVYLLVGLAGGNRSYTSFHGRTEMGPYQIGIDGSGTDADMRYYNLVNNNWNYLGHAYKGYSANFSGVPDDYYYASTMDFNFGKYPTYNTRVLCYAGDGFPTDFSVNIKVIDSINNILYDSNSNYNFDSIESGTAFWYFLQPNMVNIPNGYKIEKVTFSSDSNEYYDDYINKELSSSDTEINIYIVPDFDIIFSSSDVCDNNNVEVQYSSWKVVNNYNSDTYDDFKYILNLGGTIQEVNVSETGIGFDYHTLIYSPIDYHFIVYDRNGNFVASKIGYITGSNIDNIPDGYVSKILVKDTQYIFVSHLYDDNMIYYSNALNDHIHAYYYNLSDGTEIEITNDGSGGGGRPTNLNGFYYELANSENTILLLRIDGMHVYKNNGTNFIIYAPSGAYFSTQTHSSYIESNIDNGTNLPVYDFHYVDDQDVEHHINNEVNTNVDNSNDSDFFSRFSIYSNSAKSYFRFIGSFINTLVTNLDSNLSYALFFMFGLVVVAVIIRIWL